MFKEQPVLSMVHNFAAADVVRSDNRFCHTDGLMLANSLNEILLPVEILLILILVVFLYNSMEANDRKKEALYAK